MWWVNLAPLPPQAALLCWHSHGITRLPPQPARCCAIITLPAMEGINQCRWPAGGRLAISKPPSACSCRDWRPCGRGRSPQFWPSAAWRGAECSPRACCMPSRSGVSAPLAGALRSGGQTSSRSSLVRHGTALCESVPPLPAVPPPLSPPMPSRLPGCASLLLMPARLPGRR